MHRPAKILVLSDSIPNPNPDGRKRNWTGEKTFLPGRYFDDGNCIRRKGKHRYDYVGGIGRNVEALSVIRAAAIEVEPQGINELLLTLGGEDWAESILGLLLKWGEITPTQIKQALIALNENEDLYEQV